MSVGLALAFLSAAVMKGRAMPPFRGYLEQIRPGAARFAAAIVGIEAAIATALLLPAARTAAAIAAVLFLVGASAVVASTLVGSVGVRCMCWGEASTRPRRSIVADVGWPAWFVLRNGTLVVVSASVAGWTTVRVAAAATAVVIVVAAGLLGGIVAERRALRLPIHPRLSAYVGRLIRIGSFQVTSVNGWLPSSMALSSTSTSTSTEITLSRKESR